MLNAFRIVYSSVAGNHQVTRDASLMKRLQPGYAARPPGRGATREAWHSGAVGLFLIGAVMTLQTGGDVKFQPRLIEVSV
jgi:hypothetical protein